MTTATILEAGIYTMPAVEYHRDPCVEPSLSSSIVKTICLSSPLHAHHDHPRLNPAAVDDDSEAMDIGTAAHALFLEGAAAIAVIDAKDWRTNAAKEARELARQAGQIPLLTKSWAAVEAMVAEARGQLAHHLDGGAGMFTNGKPEQTLIWQDDGVWCRARLDWLRPGAIDDYKTTSATANPDTWTRSMFFAGHDIQAAWYLRGLRAITGHEDTIFRFAVQETFEPYALSVVGLGPDALVLAEKKCLYALDVWRACRAADTWPGYPNRTAWATLPAAHEMFWLEKESR